jgi:hypothetical protein
MTLWDYITYNPLVWALIETVVFTLLCGVWVIIFSYVSSLNPVFPVSIHPFYFMLTVISFIILINYLERMRKYKVLEKLKDASPPNEALLNKLYQRYTATGRGLNGLAVFVVYLFLLSLPWGLWGYYRKLSLVPFVLIAWSLLALMRCVNSIPTDLSKPNRFYFDSKIEIKRRK